MTPVGKFEALNQGPLIWLQTGFIGDIVLTTAGMEAAAAFWPQRRQYAITTPVGAEVLAGAPRLSCSIIFDKAGKSAFAAMRAVRAALLEVLPAGPNAVLLQAHRSTRSSLLSAYLGLPAVAYDGVSSPWARWRAPRVAVLHEAHRLALLLEPLGVPRQEILRARPRLSPLPLTPDAPWQQRLLQVKGPLVALAPGSVWGTKRWLPEGFTELARGLLTRPDLTLVLLGSPAEAALAASLAAAIANSERVLNLAGQTSLEDLRRILPRCHLLVANDSSPVHYASAFDLPTLELFGATVPGMGFGPLAERSQALGIELACRPCSDHGPQVCPLGHFRCMRELSASVVLREAFRLL